MKPKPRKRQHRKQVEQNNGKDELDDDFRPNNKKTKSEANDPYDEPFTPIKKNKPKFLDDEIDNKKPKVIDSEQSNSSEENSLKLKNDSESSKVKLIRLFKNIKT